MANSVLFSKKIHAYGDEKAFYTALINFVRNLDSRIECDDDVDTEFDPTDLTHVPEFDFTFNEKPFLKIFRPEALNTAVNGVSFTYYVDNKVSCTTEYPQQDGLPFCEENVWNEKAYNTVANRSIHIDYIISTDFIHLSFAGTIATSPSYDATGYNITGVYTKYGSNHYGAARKGGLTHTKSNIYNTSALTFYNFDTDVNGIFQTRFSYAEKPGKIDYIKSSIYCTSGTKQFDLVSIYDCTEVTPGDSISLNDGVYTAIGPHQIVKSS